VILFISQSYWPPLPFSQIVLLIYTEIMFVPQRKYTDGPPRSVTGRVRHLYTQMFFLPQRKHTYVSPRSVTGIVPLLYTQMLFLPHRKHIYVLEGLLHGQLHFFIRMECSYLTGNTPMGLHDPLGGQHYLLLLLYVILLFSCQL
jgi:hypothetical protein